MTAAQIDYMTKVAVIQIVPFLILFPLFDGCTLSFFTGLDIPF